MFLLGLGVDASLIGVEVGRVTALEFFHCPYSILSDNCHIRTC